MDKKKTPLPRQETNPSKSDVFFRELVSKEKNLLVEQLRHGAKLSQNPVIRSMHLGKPIFYDRPQDSVSRPLTQSALYRRSEESMVLSDGANVLSRGPLPSSVHADYSKLPTFAKWSDAESRHEALVQELNQLDDAIASKEMEMRRKTLEQGASGKTASLQIAALSVKPGSAIVGSAFQWQDAGRTSTVKSDFDWPSADSLREAPKASKYGLLTRTCDIPEANTHINPNAKGRRETKSKK